MPSKMSTSSQNNGKKSSNSSIVNTPSSTPVTNIANGTTQVSTQSSPPPNNNAPKYGTLVPNRIFVGGISANTTEGELMQLFSAYGTVKAAKIIQDRAGVSKGYGFITFESEDDAKRPLREAENIVLRERKLNIAPAIKKQPFSRAFDASSPPTVAAGNPTQFFFPPGAAVPYFQGGVAYYPQPAPAAPGDPSTQQPVYQPPPMYPTQTGPPQTAAYSPMMFPQTIYMPQQYPMPMPYDYNFYQGNGASPSAQYMAGAAQSGSAAAGPPQCSTMPPSNSPPRPPCYGQQMPAYNPGDPMLYNFPIYGSTLESLPIYTEAFDLGASGSYAEETIYNNLDRTVTPSHDDESTNLQTVSYCTTTTNNNNTNGTAASEQQQQQQPHVSYAKDERNNARTPVVSLLSIDHQQEKDYSSMQSGRRRKPPPPQPPPPQLLNHNNVYHHHHHGYVSHSHPFVGFNPQQPPPTTNGYAPPPPPVFNDYHRRINGCFNNNNNNNAGKIVCGKNRGDDGKSSARTAVNTPPPAPYSPMANHQFKVFTNSNVKNFMNNNNSTKQNNNYARSGKKYGVSTTPPNTTTTTIVNDKTNNNNNNNNSNSSSSNNLATPVSYSNNNRSLYNNHNSVNNVDSCSTSSTQVHLSTTTSQSFGPQTARRGKRSVRRGAGAVGGEIGAGDAPLPSDAGDVCKKLETIKL